MSPLQTVGLVGHTAIALLIIILVLLQRGKGADAGAAFGAGASGTVFGARGSSSFFSRMTGFLATAFFATSLALAFMSSQRTEAPESLIESAPEQEVVPAEDEMPALPEAGPMPGDESAEALPELPADEPQAGEEGNGDSGGETEENPQ